jgi:hypothetical protein
MPRLDGTGVRAGRLSGHGCIKRLFYPAGKIQWGMFKMRRGGVSKFVHWSLVVGMCDFGPVVASAANAAFDGSYSGETTVTYGTAPECGADGKASVAVRDGEIIYGFGAFPLKMEVARDGVFRGRARKGNRGGGQAMHVKGRISSSGLEADFVVNGVHGHVCSYHWSLRKV